MWARSAHNAPAPQYAAVPLEGWGPHSRPRPTMIRGAGPEHPWDAAATELLRAAPEPYAGPSGDVSSVIRALLPPRLVLQAPNMLQATEIHTSGCDATTFRCLPPEDGGTRLTVAHFKDGGRTYNDALSRLPNVPVPLLLMLPTDLTPCYAGSLRAATG